MVFNEVKFDEEEKYGEENMATTISLLIQPNEHTPAARTPDSSTTIVCCTMTHLGLDRWTPTFTYK